MALLAEELVEEWLNRQGFFTIRGVKLGVHEMDLLAIRLTEAGIECRHVEVQVSIRPVSYVTKLAKYDQKRLGKAASSSVARTPEMMARAVAAWIEKKFELKEKAAVRETLAPGPWTRELVIHNVAHEEEIEALEASGIAVVRLERVLAELAAGGAAVVGASGGNLVELVWLGKLVAPTKPDVEALEGGPEAE